MHNNKKKVLAGTLAVALLVSGTFAWQSFSQLATNEIIEEVVQPGARLHDYFNGVNKDVFVENYGPEGGSDVFARIQLSEYFEYGKDAGKGTSNSLTIVSGDIDSGATPEFGKEATWDTYDYYAASEFDAATNTEETIRKYRELTLGGETVYLPTFNLHPYSLDAEVNGTFLGEDGDGRTNKESRYDDYVVYTVDEIVEGDEITPDPADPKNPLSVSVVVNEDEEHTAKLTAKADIMTMEDWIDGGCELDDVWVFDEDGWAYYAKAIPAASATGLLIDGISITSNPQDEWYYAIHVTAQFASAGDWGVGEASNGDDVLVATGTGMYAGGMSQEGLYLLNKAAGLVTVDNMVITQENGDDLTADDALLSNLSTTFAVNMEVINSLGYENETDVMWTVTAEGSDVELGTGTDDTFTVTTAMTVTTGRYVLTATSVLDASKSVSITLHDGTSTKLPVEVAVTSAGNATSIEPGDTLQYSAKINGKSSTAVTWSLVSDETGVSINETSGLLSTVNYTIADDVTVEVVATSTLDTDDKSEPISLSIKRTKLAHDTASASEITALAGTTGVVRVNGADFYVIGTDTVDSKTAVKLLLKTSTGTDSEFGDDSTYAESTVETAVGTWYDSWLLAGAVDGTDVVTGSFLVGISSGTPALTDTTTAFLLSNDEAGALVQNTIRTTGVAYGLRTSNSDAVYSVDGTGVVLDDSSVSSSFAVRPAVWIYL